MKLIKSQVQSGPARNIDKKTQPIRRPLAFSSTMEGVCSAQVQAQNKHSRALHQAHDGGYAEAEIVEMGQVFSL